MSNYRDVPVLNEVVFVEELIDLMPMYFKNVNNDYLKLVNAIENKDFVEMQRVSHRVKGSAASYGFENIDAMMANIELAAKKQDLSTVVNQVEKFFTVLQMIEIKLKSVQG